MQLSLVTEDNRISRAGQPGVDVWGYAHELGHDFTFVDGDWTYQVETLESWPNLFSIYALESLGLPLHNNTVSCDSSSMGSYNAWDPWVGLCFLRQLQ